MWKKTEVTYFLEMRMMGMTRGERRKRSEDRNEGHKGYEGEKN